MIYFEDGTTYVGQSEDIHKRLKQYESSHALKSIQVSSIRYKAVWED